MEQFKEFNIKSWMDASGCLDLSVKLANKVVGKVSKVAFASAVVAAVSLFPNIANVVATEDVMSVAKRTDAGRVSEDGLSVADRLARLNDEFERGIADYLNPVHDFSPEMLALADRALNALA